MPGDVLTDTITVSNTTDSAAEILFRTSTEGRNSEQIAMLKDVKLTVAMGNKILYSGTLDSTGLARNKTLGILEAGQKGSMKFRLEIPAEWDNRMAQKKQMSHGSLLLMKKKRHHLPIQQEDPKAGKVLPGRQ